MKAILVIDMPKHCKDCALNYDNQNCLGIEVFTKVSIEDDRPSWCPLKPMPHSKQMENRWFSDDYSKGWNTCLEKIEG